jgi:hypothetical protein
LGDKSNETLVAALTRAAAEPGGVPLHGVLPAGLFTASPSAKKAAQHCKAQGYLQVVRTEPRGRGVREICAITEKGLAYLLNQVSPKQVLGELVRALHGQQSQIGELLTTVRQWQASIDSYKSFVDKCLHQGERIGSLHTASLAGSAALVAVNGKSKPAGLGEKILELLDRWQGTGDCPVVELYHLLGPEPITIGQFHDELRRLLQEEQIYLHPWTGPLPEIPEPGLALLAGHGIAYYASRRFPCR